MTMLHNEAIKTAFRQFLLGSLFLSGSFCFSQSSNYLIPPGASISPKTDLNKDYSTRLGEMVNPTGEQLIVNFLQDFSSNELKEMEIEAPAKFNYYNSASLALTSLSDKVKYNFTIDELWYIYMFDQRLFDQLNKIK